MSVLLTKLKIHALYPHCSGSRPKFEIVFHPFRITNYLHVGYGNLKMAHYPTFRYCSSTPSVYLYYYY